MNRITRLPAIAMVLFGILFTAQDLHAKDEWIRVKTENFSMIGNAGEKKIKDVGQKLEQFRHVFTRLFPSMNAKSPVPTAVVVFKSEGSFKKFKSIKWAAGYFQPGEDINYIALHTGNEKEQLYSTIFHEYIHYLVNNNIGRSRMPPWFSEGIAEFYDQFKIENDQIVTLGLPNNSHLRSLQNSSLIPFDTFFNIDHYSLHQQGSHGANVFYAQSWALVHYLMKGNNGARVDQLSKFLELLVSGMDSQKAFLESFNTDYKTMENELKKYVKQNKYGISVATFQSKLIFEDKMESSPMSEIEANAELGDLLYHIRKYDEAEELLREALATDPDQPSANATMGMLRMRQQKPDEAKTFLEKATRADSKNYRIYYQYAYVLSREGRSTGSVIDQFGSETGTKIKEALAKSIALNPNFPASYDLLARVSLITGNDIEGGIDNLNKALALSPGNQYYMLNLANLYMRKRDFDSALPIVENVYKTADEDGLRSYASNLLQSLRNTQSTIADAKRNGYELRDAEDGNLILSRGTVVTSAPLSDEEQKQLTAKSINDEINRMMRKPEDGEVRLIGRLMSVTCPSGEVVYSLNTDSGPIKLTSKDFQSLMIDVYNTGVADVEVGCNLIKKEMRGVFTYKPTAKTKSGTIGEMIAIEFVGEDFSLIEK